MNAYLFNFKYPLLAGSQRFDFLVSGSIASIKSFKDEVDSVKKEQECGIAIDDQEFVFQSQDLIVNFEIKEVDQEIDWDHGF